MKKIMLNTCLILSLMIVSLSANSLESAKALSSRSDPQIFEGQDINGIFNFIDKHTLVVFDIDDTLFRARTSFGSAEWGTRLIHAEMAKGKSFHESAKKIMPLWIKAQKFNMLTLVDERMPKILNEIRKHALGCIAFTRRSPQTLEITRWQLDKFGIRFDKGVFSELKVLSHFRHPTLYQEGVLFAHDFNESASVFQDWIQKVKTQLSKQKTIKKVVLVDDSLHHITAMQEAVEALDIEFVGLRYSAADEYKKVHNPRLAAKELEILTQNISDTEIHLLLEEAGSYTENLAQAN